MIELKDCGSSTSQQTTTEPKAQIKQHYEKKRERERKKIKYMIQAPWQCSGNLDQNQLHGNAVEIDGSKYQRQNLNPAELHNPAIKTGKFKKNIKEKNQRKTK
jgi:hypothetical protein